MYLPRRARKRGRIKSARRRTKARESSVVVSHDAAYDEAKKRAERTERDIREAIFRVIGHAPTLGVHEGDDDSRPRSNTSADECTIRDSDNCRIGGVSLGYGCRSWSAHSKPGG